MEKKEKKKTRFFILTAASLLLSLILIFTSLSFSMDLKFPFGIQGQFFRSIEDKRSFVGVLGSKNCDICVSFSSVLKSRTVEEYFYNEFFVDWQSEIDKLEKKEITFDFYYLPYVYNKDEEGWKKKYSSAAFVKKIYLFLYQESDRKRNKYFKRISGDGELEKKPTSLPAPIVFFVKNGYLRAVNIGIPSTKPLRIVEFVKKNIIVNIFSD